MEEFVGYQMCFFVLGFVFAWWIDLFHFVFLRFFFSDSEQ